MKKQFGLTRKIMRLGKFVEHIKAASVATDAKTMDPVLRVCAVGRQLGYAAYMTFDNIAAVSWTILCRLPLDGGYKEEEMELGDSRMVQTPGSNMDDSVGILMLTLRLD
jgi:hypothetical protein